MRLRHSRYPLACSAPGPEELPWFGASAGEIMRGRGEQREHHLPFPPPCINLIATILCLEQHAALIGWRSNRKSFLAVRSLNYKRAQVVLINNTANMSDEQGCAAAITRPRAALHIPKLLSWMLILKWTPARTLQGTKAECDTVPATVPARILSVVDILTTDANNSSNNSIKHAGAGLRFECMCWVPSAFF